ncbi:alpha-2-macroglobulin-like isoform X2 [Amphibalanus amphitrite]|uniref:alpha-2-macroglobulin-like isoform X2 n=1 Tax=Amphibalanus amphitrite TaxID=1232801 RepID=UPI001C91B23F|nr:alpha-2-macroglobulin-like isoform X2 [Amphibalanus amphitrite]
MIAVVAWLALLALAPATSATSFADKGFLLTCPKSLIAGTKEKCCVSFYQLARQTVRLNVHLLPKKNSTTADSVAKYYKETYIRGASDFRCFSLSIPKKSRSGTLYLKVSVQGYYFQSTKTSPVNVVPYTLVTLVQTDKSKYKAGQEVLFRVVTLKSDLTAQEETVDQIYITTPAGTRLAQWNQKTTSSGIIALSFKLTQEPPLGMWTIHVKRGDRITKQTFEVDEFVLPRFEVTVTGPKFIVRDANTVTLKVCAKYTFGEPVSSADVVLLAKRTVPSYFYSRNRYGELDRRGETPSNITLEDTSDSKGCAEFDVLLSKIGVGRTFRNRGIYVNQVIIQANVTEAGTGLVLGSDLVIPIQTPRISVEIDERPGTKFIKPGLEYIGFVTVKGADGDPLSDETLQVCHTESFIDQGAIKPIKKSENPFIAYPSYQTASRGVKLVNKDFNKLPIIYPAIPSKTDQESCNEYKSNKDGRIRFRIAPQSAGIISSNVNVRTRRSGLSGSDYVSLKGWFSLTDSYISIVPVRDPYGLKCEGSLRLTVKSNIKVPQMTYLVMTRGQIHTSGKVARDGSIEIKLNFRVSPSFKVLVYYVNGLGETIADSKTYSVANCFQNQVKVSWDQEKVEPGDPAVLTIRGARNSLCGISVVDRSVELLSDKNKLTAKKVFEKLQKFVIGEYQYPRLVESDSSYCKRKPRHARPGHGDIFGFPNEFQLEDGIADRERVPPSNSRNARRIRPIPRPTPDGYWYRTRQDDSIKAFEVAGYLVFSNFVLESRPCEKRNRSSPIYYGKTTVLGGFTSSSGSRPALAKTSAGDAVFEVTETAQRGGSSTVSADSAAPEPAAETAVRSLFPPTFLFQLEKLGGSGRKDISTTMPDTITSWVASAFCSGLRSGFGLSDTATIVTFKPFFAQIQVPYSVKRGELLRLKVSVFNFLSSDLSVAVVLASSTDFSVASGGSGSQTVCVRASKPSVVEFPLEFSTLGKVNITVSARTSGSACGSSNQVQASDALVRSLIVKPEGFPQEEVNTAFICKEDSTSPPKEETFELALPNQLVPDSQRAWVNIVGDLIAPSAENLERLVRVPTGCGEQNMIGFVPNILVRRYLEEVKLLTDSLKDRTTANMRTGYQRQLRYRRREGSYSAFPERSPPRYKGSLWLTAYVVRSYMAASKYIAIDKNDVSISTSWIVKLQESNGAFKSYGNLFHKEMRGGVGNGAVEAMTAYVLLTLLEANDQPAAAKKAVDFLLASSTYSTLYAEILVAHALVMAGKTSEGSSRVQTLLTKGTRRGGQLYWKGDRTSKYGGSRAVDIEMTSYMAMTLLKLGGSSNLGEAALAVKWISAQRNSQGGFVSTQDTVVALTALTEFAIATYSESTAVDVLVTASPSYRYSVQITAENRLLTRQDWLPQPLALPKKVTFSVNGLGCAVVQSVFRYNTKVAFPDPKFNLKAVITKVKSSCSFTLNICTSFKEPNTESNMAIVEIEMLSGFVTIDSSLRKLENDKVIERWEFNEGKASLYFEEFTDKEVCFDVRFIRALEVEKLKPAVLRVYDYYAHEDRFEVTYGPPECP